MTVSVRGAVDLSEDEAEALRDMDEGDRVAVPRWETPLTVRDSGEETGAVTYRVTGSGGTYRLRVWTDSARAQLVRQPSSRSPGLQYVDFSGLEVQR